MGYPELRMGSIADGLDECDIRVGDLVEVAGFESQAVWRAGRVVRIEPEHLLVCFRFAVRLFNERYDEGHSAHYFMLRITPTQGLINELRRSETVQGDSDGLGEHVGFQARRRAGAAVEGR